MMHFYIVQKLSAHGDWLHEATYGNEKGADDCYYKLAADNRSDRYRILEQKVIKQTLENQ